MKRIKSLAIAATLLLAIGCDRGKHPGQIGEVAPTFTVKDASHSINLSQYRGKTVVLNFWASWCVPCIEELPSLMALQKAMPNIQVLAVSIDDDDTAYQNFMKEYGVTLLSIRDGSEGANLKFGSVRVPETFAIDKNGIIRRKFISSQQWTSPEIMDFLNKL